MKKRNILYLSSVMVIAGFFVAMSSCTKDSGPIYIAPQTPIDTLGLPTVSFADDIVPIFIDHCVQCHPPTVELDLQEEAAYDEIVNVVSGSYGPDTLIVPFNPETSVLYQKMINSGVYGIGMPPPDGMTDQVLLDIMETWILEGALDN